MSNTSILRLMEERESTRIPFKPDEKVPKRDLDLILEAARWAPTAHNMQNFEIIAVDDTELLRKIGEVRSHNFRGLPQGELPAVFLLAKRACQKRIWSTRKHLSARVERSIKIPRDR